jgi:hypothetical protein
MTPAIFLREFVRRQLAGLTDDQYAAVVDILAESADLGESTHDAAARLEPILLPTLYAWPAFEEWGRRFRELGAFPSLWTTLGLAARERERRREVFLFARSAIASWCAAQRLVSLAESRRLVDDLEGEIAGPEPSDPCPVCPSRAGFRFDPARPPADAVPPFHPGCGCEVVAYRQTWENERKN